MEDSSIICTKCNAKIKSDSHFCTECGNPVDETQPDNAKIEGVDKNEVQNSLLKSEIRCPQCNHQLNSEDAFCTECGFKIEISSNCPQCSSPIPPGTSFCTECGINIYQYKPTTIQAGPKTVATSPSLTSNTPPPDHSLEEFKQTGKDLLDDVEKTGRELMKDLDNFLGKSTKRSSKTIKPARKDQKFLVCDQCGGYYQLQTGESADDFSNECDCGGHLLVKNKPP
ncbi:MAG: zinc-ribbon domain-containing protein [Methanobacterium sp.]|jgi:DNA-directed RNA polymerase subunit RPC12/RpoP